MSQTVLPVADLGASNGVAEPPAAGVTRSPARFVLLGGVPGAGKTTLIRRMAGDYPHVRTVDPDPIAWADRLRRSGIGVLPLLPRRGAHVDGRPCHTRRGRVLAHRSFARHWNRWQEQRPALGTAYRRGLGTTPWREVHVVDREGAFAVLRGLLH